ncbi:hypothetical protein ACEU2D_25085 [Brevibacillus laterosporus]|uniref:hypothetical protein n=1 Tax=Brevibacillus laterosporus TaxID=1465 RepID=UPI0035A5AB80
MKTIGRKIYFDKLTGNALLDTGERYGFVLETTREQDFESYAILKERVSETVGCIQLEYGQFADNFSRGYTYHIDTETNEIAWNLTPPQVEEREREKTVQEKMESLEKENADLRKQIETLAGTVDYILEV